jgi:hypothetical protein
LILYGCSRAFPDFRVCSSATVIEEVADLQPFTG